MPLIESISLRNLPEEEVFPFTLPLIKNLERVELTTPITFFVGENGSGKSTLLEGIAAHLNLPTAGSMPIAEDPMLEPARILGKWLYLQQKSRNSRGLFTRAEDFIGFVKSVRRQIAELDLEMQQIAESWTGGDLSLALGPLKGEKAALIARYGEDLDAMSHGEGFLKFFLARITGKGLYLIDEPEAALSPQRQLSLISLIRQKARDVGAQFIIATHSPIIMAIPEASILEFKEGKISKVSYKETEHYQLTKQFLAGPDVFLREL